MNHPAASILLVACSAVPLLHTIAQQTISVVNTPIVQNFNTLPGTGADLPAMGSIFTEGWSFLENGTAKNALFGTGNGSSNTGDTYSFGTTASIERAFGMLQSGSVTTIIGYKFMNNTGQTISSIRIGFAGELWRFSASADALAFSYQVGNVALDAGTGWNLVSALLFSTPATGTGMVDGNSSTYRTALSPVTITGLTIAPGAVVTFRWVDATATNSAGMAIDDFSLTLFPAFTGYFRSRGSGDWNDANAWEISNDNLSWSPTATVVPSSLAAGIMVQTNHTLAITNNTSVNKLSVQPGGKLVWLAGTLTVADGPGEDFVIQGAGSEWEVATNASPVLIGAASVRVGSGAILKLNGTNNVLAYHGNAYTYGDKAVFEYSNTASPNITGTFFSLQDAGAIPVFRYNSPVLTSLGGSGATVVNGRVEIVTGRTLNLNGVTGALVLRNGITGDGNISSLTNMQLTGSTAILGGTGTINSHLTIQPGCTATVLADKVFSAGRNITVNGVLDFEIRQFRTVSGTATLVNNATGVLKTASPFGLLSENGSLKTGAFTLNFSAGSTVEYTAAANQQVSILNVPAYQNLLLSGMGTKSVQSGGNLVIQSACTIQPGSILALTGNAAENVYLNNNALLDVKAGATFDNGGESSITASAGTPSVLIAGTFRTRDAQGFTGSGAAIPSIIPVLSNGSTIEYGRSGDQDIQATLTYHHLACSGAGIKTPSNAVTLNGTVTVSESAVLNGAFHTIGGPLNNLVMTGTSRLVVGVTGTQPAMGGNYSLSSGTTIEFANNNNTTATIRQGGSPVISYANIEITGSNITAPHSGITLQAGATFSVKNGGTLKLTSVNGLHAASGAAVLTSNSPALVLEPGSTIEYGGGAQSITSLAYHHLIISGTGAKTASTPFSVSQTFTRSGDATLLGNSPVYGAGATLAYVDGAAGRTYTQVLEWPVVYPPQNIRVNLTGSGLPALRLNRNQAIPGDVTLVAGSLQLDGYHLEISGSLSGGGTLTGSPVSALTFQDGNSTVRFTQSVDGTSNALASLAVRKGAIRLGNRLQVYEVLDLAGGSLDLNHQSLVLKSGPVQTARVAERKGALVNATNVTVERYIAGTYPRRWRLLTAPVTGGSVQAAWQEGRTWNGGASDNASPGYGTLITGQQQGTAVVANAAGFDFWTQVAGAQASIRRYQGSSSSSAASWQPLSSTHAYNFTNGEAYLLFVRGDRSVSVSGGGSTVLRATGGLKEFSTITVPVNTTNSHTLVGNPYASPLHFRKLHQDNAGVIKPYFWIWQAALSATGGYALVKPVTEGSAFYEVIPSGSNVGTPVEPVIHSGQGFFVVPAVAPTSSNLVIQQAHKTADNPTVSVLRETGGEPAKLYINFFASGSNEETLLDGVLLQWEKDANRLPLESIGKAINSGENLSIHQPGKDWLVKQEPMPDRDGEIQLRIWNTTPRTYKFQISCQNLGGQGQRLWLLDRYREKEIPLIPGNSSHAYEFTINSEEASRDPLRFKIIYRVSVTLPLPVQLTNLKVVEKENGVQVAWEGRGEERKGSYTIERSPDGQHFLPLGKLPAKGGAGPNAYAFPDLQPLPLNFYRVKCEEADGSYHYSAVVKWAKGTVREGVVIFPNPVTGGKMQVQLRAKPKGRYKFLVYTLDGKAVWQHPFDHVGGTATLVLDTGRNWPAGIYTMEIRCVGGKPERLAIFYWP
ncbi:hypothetical protein HRH25_09730 [Flavisolibacter sp. BT320]|nr:hypothetical protein [Flavisolibacter longurius]